MLVVALIPQSGYASQNFPRISPRIISKTLLPCISVPIVPSTFITFFETESLSIVSPVWQFLINFGIGIYGGSHPMRMMVHQGVETTQHQNNCFQGAILRFIVDDFRRLPE